MHPSMLTPLMTADGRRGRLEQWPELIAFMRHPQWVVVVRRETSQHSRDLIVSSLEGALQHSVLQFCWDVDVLQPNALAALRASTLQLALLLEQIKRAPLQVRPALLLLDESAELMKHIIEHNMWSQAGPGFKRVVWIPPRVVDSNTQGWIGILRLSERVWIGGSDEAEALCELTAPDLRPALHNASVVTAVSEHPAILTLDPRQRQ